MIFMGRQSCKTGGETREAAPILRAGPSSSPPFWPRWSSRPATRCPGPGRPPGPRPPDPGAGRGGHTRPPWPRRPGLSPTLDAVSTSPRNCPLAPTLDKPEQRTGRCPERTWRLPRPCPSGSARSRSRPPRPLVIGTQGSPALAGLLHVWPLRPPRPPKSLHEAPTTPSPSSAPRARPPAAWSGSLLPQLSRRLGRTRAMPWVPG